MVNIVKAILTAYISFTIYLYIFYYAFCNFNEPNALPEVFLHLERGLHVDRNKECPDFIPGLEYGPIRVNASEVKMIDVEKRYRNITLFGGRYTPPCIARHSVAVIVPFRDRELQLPIFLNHMHAFLIRQQIEYRIYVVEQKGREEYNKGMLMNVGFVEAARLAGARRARSLCYVFHDVDLLALDTRLRYRCHSQPRHLSTNVDTLRHLLHYREIFGGVTAMTHDQLTDMNGFSNSYAGWGGEDDDAYLRVIRAKYSVSRDKPWIARYKMLRHKKAAPNPSRYAVLRRARETILKDGLSTLRYRVASITPNLLYTHILVDID